MVEQEAPALLERVPAVVQIGEAVVGPRDDVQRPRFGGPLEEPPAVVGRHHLVAVGLDHEHAGDAGGRVGPLPAPYEPWHYIYKAAAATAEARTGTGSTFSSDMCGTSLRRH